MKKIILCLFLLTFSSPTYSATPSLKDFKIDNTNQLYSKRNMSYFINQGYKLVLQETRGIRTAYVLKKGKDYVGPEDIQDVAPDVLSHRLVLSFEAEADGVTANQIIDKLLNNIGVP